MGEIRDLWGFKPDRKSLADPVYENIWGFEKIAERSKGINAAADYLLKKGYFHGEKAEVIRGEKFRSGFVGFVLGMCVMAIIMLQWMYKIRADEVFTIK